MLEKLKFGNNGLNIFLKLKKLDERGKTKIISKGTRLYSPHQNLSVKVN